MDYLIRNTDLRLDYQPESCALTITLGTHQWHWDSEPCIVLSDGTTLPFSCASCTSAPLKTGVTEGVAATYTNFHTDSVNYPFTLDTFVGLDAATGFLRVEFSLTGEQEGEIDAVLYPPQMRVEDPNGYTLLPRMQGSLLPRGSKLCIHRGIVYERDAYMPIYGQLEHGGGWLTIFDTPFDARYRFREDQVQPIFIPSLGKMRERRVMFFAFRAQCSYVELAKIYRGYLRERGMLVTLKEKIARNPNVAKMIGTPIIHTGIAVHIHPDSSFYDKEHPENNDTVVPFSQRAQELRALREKGVAHACVHVDGWGVNGYDDRHPDIFPVHAAAGGAEGLRALQQTCTELGYLFCVHDQYHDYYYSAESYSPDSAVTDLDGGHPFLSFWYGGKQSVLCASLAPEYVRRNYHVFEQLGIQIDSSYLDVFSVVALNECFHPRHRMTREQCAQKRRECLDVLSARGIVPSSEEVLGCIADAQVMCHHAPFYTDALCVAEGDTGALGIPVPLLSLVYHDCVIVPWNALSRGGVWGVDAKESAFVWALLCAGPIYYEIDATEEEIALGKIALELHAQVAMCELTTHEWSAQTPHRRRSVFSDGTVVEGDLHSGEFSICYPDGRCVSGCAGAPEIK